MTEDIQFNPSNVSNKSLHEALSHIYLAVVASGFPALVNRWADMHQARQLSTYTNTLFWQQIDVAEGGVGWKQGPVSFNYPTNAIPESIIISARSFRERCLQLAVAILGDWLKAGLLKATGIMEQPNSTDDAHQHIPLWFFMHPYRIDGQEPLRVVGVDGDGHETGAIYWDVRVDVPAPAAAVEDEPVRRAAAPSSDSAANLPAAPAVDIDALYDVRVEEHKRKYGRPPPLESTKEGTEGDRKWAVRNKISRTKLKKLRDRHIGLVKLGRPEKSAGNSAE